MSFTWYDQKPDLTMRVWSRSNPSPTKKTIRNPIFLTFLSWIRKKGLLACEARGLHKMRYTPSNREKYNYFLFNLIQIAPVSIVGPSLYLFYIVTYLKWVKTSWTYNIDYVFYYANIIKLKSRKQKLFIFI